MRWEGELPAAPQEVWDAITRHSGGLAVADRRTSRGSAAPSAA